MLYLKYFETEAARTSCTDTQEYVSYTEESDKVNIMNLPFFCKITLNNGDVIKIEGSGELTEAMISGYSATMVSAEIGNLCTSVEYNAFHDFASLTSVIIGNKVTTINGSAFIRCRSLTSITIGSSVSSIDTWAFLVCPALTNIVVDSNNTVFDSRDNCNAIIETATNTLIQGCKTTVIPNSVTSIGDQAFDYCSGLTSITIPNSVTSISRRSFAECGLTQLTIPNSVTSIGGAAFLGCTSLTSITIPNRVTSIGKSVFKDCTSLTSITIPNSVTSISNYVFSGCTSLTSITIPNSITSIGDSAFYKCTSLTSIMSLATTAPTINASTFSNVKTGGTLYVPSGSSGYDTWMQNANYYLGKYNWTKVEQ